MPSTEKLERLLNLTAALLETSKPLTAEEIAAKIFGYPEDRTAFRRAFERDKEALREMGIPVELLDIPNTDPPRQGYRIPKEQYYLRDPGLDAEELAALQLALSAVRLEGVEATPGLWKLGGAPAPLTTGEAPAGVAEIPSDDRLVCLFGAVAERRAVRFTYRDELRTVDPYRLDFQRGHWYVTGYDHTRADERVFRVDRMQGDVVAGPRGTFEPPSVGVPGGRAEPWQLGEGEPVRGRVLVDADQAAITRSTVGDACVVETRDDGSVVIELPVTNPDGFRAFVLGFLEHAEVLGPPELRADVVAWLHTVAASGKAER